MSQIRRTPYYHQHLALGAEWVDRFGFKAAFHFGDPAAEHHATRTAVGLFDVYGQFFVEVAGRGAEGLLQRLAVNDLSRIGDHQAQYTSLCTPEGGMVDDLTVYRQSGDRFWLCPTPSRVRAVAEWVDRHRAGHDAMVTPLGYRFAYLSVQGPHSRQLLQSLTDTDLSAEALRYFRFTWGTLADVPDTMISRTGYSGELGFELFYPSEYAEHMFDRLMTTGAELGVRPCGLMTLASLRMEKRYPLYGLDLNESTSPVEAGLGWTVRLDKGDFIGRDVLARQKQQGPQRQLVQVRMAGLEADVRIGDRILDGAPEGDSASDSGQAIGTVTSVARGHSLQATLAMAYVPTALAEEGRHVTVVTAEGARLAASVVLRPLYDPDRIRVNA